MNKEKAIQTLGKFLKAWKEKNLIKMYKLCQITWKNQHSKKEFEYLFEHFPLDEYNILDSKVLGQYSLRAVIKIKSSGKEATNNNVMLLCETNAYQPSPTGIWGVNPISILNMQTK